MRILFLTQMWPGPSDPDFGSFLPPIVRELEASGHELEVVAIDHRGSSRMKYPGLTARGAKAGRSFKPDVVFAHMLFPAGAAALVAGIAGRAPVVVMAHGQDVDNLGAIPGVTAATKVVVRRASGVICNSEWLAAKLCAVIPSAREKVTIANCGIDLESFSPIEQAQAQQRVGWPDPDAGGPAFVCVGSLIGRKNVIALADAFERLAEDTPGARLAFIGDGELRPALEGRRGVTVVGRIPQSEVPGWVGAADVVCQPSLMEPFGQAALEGMAMERSVLGTTVGGPPEFVTPDAGVLIDPGDPEAMVDGMRRASEMPTPNTAAREAASAQDVKVQVARMAEALERAASAREG